MAASQKGSIFFQTKTYNQVSKKKKHAVITEHSLLGLISFINVKGLKPEKGKIGFTINKFLLFYLADKFVDNVLPIILSFFRS